MSYLKGVNLYFWATYWILKVYAKEKMPWISEVESF